MELVNCRQQSNYAEQSKQGRLPGYAETKTVEYNNKMYCVTLILYKGQDVYYVYDAEEYEKVCNKSWHVSSGKYIGANYIAENEKIKEVYIHNLIMNNLSSEKENYVIHINKNYFDNRKENLKIVASEEYYLTKSKKKRISMLPEDSGITLDDIPKYVSYMKSYGKHGDRFCIEIPNIPFFWKSSSSKNIPLSEKLQNAKEILEKIYEEYPHLNPNKDNDLINKLNKDFEEIIRLSQEV
jgi:hypothetical protein